MSVYKGLKYYKYESWTQPTLSSDTSYGNISSSITTWGDGQVWHISDGVKGTSNKWGGDSGSGNITWHLSEKIKINSFQVWQTNESEYLNRFPKTIKLYASDDGTNYTEVGSLSEYSQPASAEYVSVTCNTSKVYEYYKWEFGTSWKGSEIAVSEIVITAQKVVTGTSSDYDFVELQKINEVYRGFKYYKYQSWTQPALSSNTTTVTEGNIVVSASSNYSGEDPWRALDGNNSGTSFAFNSVPTGWWQVKFPYKLRITGLTFCQRENAGSYRTNTARFYTSSDKSTPIGNEFNPPATSYAQTVVSDIPSAGIITDTIYLDVTDGLTSAGMSELIITAQKVIAGTSSSYDYSEPQKIAKIYKGSELVYSSISGSRFQLYGYSGNASDHFGVSKTFLIGGMTLGNPYCNNFIHSTYGEYSFWAAIKNISGTLGESGSTITYRAENFPNDVTFNYYNTYQVNGITLYFYLNSSSVYEGSWVMEGSTIGSICLDVKLANSYSFGYPTAASESSCTTYVSSSQYTFNRDSSLDCIWTLEGIK